MVVCKFFQEGYCRYGQNCRFEHIYGSKYTYHANAPAQAAPQSQAPSGVTDEQLVQQVQTDVNSALKGKQWILSCYAPFKEKPVFPGLSDLSPEEARLFIYKAKTNNNVDQAMAYMNNLTQEARSKYEQLLLNTPNNVKVLRSLYKGEPLSAPFGQTQNAFGSQSQSHASSLFRSALQTTQTNNASPFGQSQSPFGQSTAQSVFSQANASNTNPSPFGNDPAQSIFSQATQNAFGSPQTQNNFFGAAETAQSIFGQANKSQFDSATPAAPFKSPFEQPSPFAQNTNNVFQKTESPASIFGQTAQSLPAADDAGVYSNPDALSPEDLEMFQADSFKLGFIPEVPPPHSLCV